MSTAERVVVSRSVISCGGGARSSSSADIGDVTKLLYAAYQHERCLLISCLAGWMLKRLPAANDDVSGRSTRMSNRNRNRNKKGKGNRCGSRVDSGSSSGSTWSCACMSSRGAVMMKAAATRPSADRELPTVGGRKSRSVMHWRRA